MGLQNYKLLLILVGKLWIWRAEGAVCWKYPFRAQHLLQNLNFVRIGRVNFNLLQIVNILSCCLPLTSLVKILTLEVFHLCLRCCSVICLLWIVNVASCYLPQFESSEILKLKVRFAENPLSNSTWLDWQKSACCGILVPTSTGVCRSVY